MPELPEVETVKEILKKQIIGDTITDITINYSKIIKETDPATFRQNLIGQTFRDILRRGKYLVFVLDDYILLSHLRMEGKYFIKSPNDEISKHEHIIFRLGPNKTLRYHDTRKFGTMYLFHTTSFDIVNNMLPLKELGVEPLGSDFTLAYLKEKLTKSHRSIKTSLLDQSVISGLGNIYVNEILFLSKIHPLENSDELTDEDITNIIDNTKRVLNHAIELGGTTIHSFQSALEVSGRFQNELRIHMQKICPVCHGEVSKIYVGQRGTYYCKVCQVQR